MLTLYSFARRFAFGLWPWYLFGACFLAATNLITLEIPQLQKEIVDGLNTAHLATHEMIRYSISIALLGLIQIITRSLSRILIFWPGRKPANFGFSSSSLSPI